MSEMMLELDGVEDFHPIAGLDRSKFDRIFVLTYMGTHEWARMTGKWRQIVSADQASSPRSGLSPSKSENPQTQKKS